jgi:glycerol-3-phosphate dehydrogenase
VQFIDAILAKQYEIRSKVVINATGVFTDDILKMDDANAETLITVSQGIHIVLDRNFLSSDTAIMIPRTDDKRVLFAVPWHHKIIVGTTETPIDKVSDEPVALRAEVEFVLHHISKYLTKDPGYADIQSMFAGLRPLVKGNTKHTAALSREHHITISDSELITITGGKWTTYRKMAEDVLDIAVIKAGLEANECKTKELAIQTDFNSPLYYYGSDQEFILQMIKTGEAAAGFIHPALPFVKAEIIWAVQQEMCMTVEDFLSRRTRALLLDAKSAIESAPLVARIMAKEMQKDENWMEDQLASFNSIAKNYLPGNY